MKRALSIGLALGKHSINILLLIITMNIVIVALAKNHRERLLWGKKGKKRKREGGTQEGTDPGRGMGSL